MVPESQFQCAGDPQALARLIASMYEELRSMAHRCLRSERAGHTLNTTALVHEVYLRLRSQRQLAWENRTHFFGTAAAIMRRVLTDYARAQAAAKRKADDGYPITALASHPHWEVLAVDQALDRLARRDARQARIVELRYFVGLSIEETAEALGLSNSTVKNEWALAKAWLHREISGAEGP